MNEKILYNPEKEPIIKAVESATESLLEINDSNNIWPDEIRKNEKIAEQVKNRQESIETVEEIFSQVPIGMEITEALDSKIIDNNLFLKIFKNLIELFNTDQYNKRLILYFPFELIPNKQWKSDNNEINGVVDDFIGVYTENWYKLLNIVDVRANFVDGDVLETELRTKPLERVTKAAHLVPKLIEKEIISFEEISELIYDNPKSNLQKSLIETLPVLLDMRLISTEQMEKILELSGEDIVEYRKEELPVEKISEARQKWLQEKDKPTNITKHSDSQLEMSFEEKEIVLKEDISVVKKIVKSIESSEVLSKYLYPAAIFFGSKIKGYATNEADTDIALFVKPETNIVERDKIHDLLKEILPTDKFSDGSVEFWLEEKDYKLNIVDFPNSDKKLAKSTWTHVLFEGMWIGDNSVIKEMHEKLLPHYLENPENPDTRRVWLEEMERDTLQYRLMHKGYARFFQKQGGINTEHSNQIDGESMFYDSGYRRLATKLFLSKVFLPLSEE